MTENPPPVSDSVLKNPQVIAALIGGLITILVAVIGIVPGLLNATKPTPPPTLIVVTATPPATSLPELPTSTPFLQAVEPVSVVATVTPLQLQQVVAAPTDLLPAVTNVLLLFDEVSFTLLNQSSATLSLEGVTFHSATGDWEARSWGPSVYNSLPAGKCLRLRDATVGQRNPPQPCANNIYGLQEVGKSALFWVGGVSFDVLRNGELLATCQFSDTTCSISVN